MWAQVGAVCILYTATVKGPAGEAFVPVGGRSGVRSSLSLIKSGSHMW